jgi:hypothetical protein
LKRSDELDVGHVIQSIYKTLSEEIHAATIKLGSGMYEVPLVPNLSESELRVVEKIVTQGLGWKGVKFVHYFGNEQDDEKYKHSK